MYQSNTSIFNFSILFDGKVKLVVVLGMSTFKIASSFQKLREKVKKKLKENREFLPKIGFRHWNKFDIGY